MSVTAPVSDSSTRPVQVKLVLLGESAVGKSSVVLRFCQNDFQANKEPTIGAAFLTQRCRLEDKVIKFEIWDTAGQERFRSLSPMYYRNAQSAVVVYDVTKAASLEQAKTWVKELQRQANPNIVIALVGNKVDLVRASSSEEDATPTTPTGTGSDEEEDDATATPEGDDSVEEDAENAAPNESRRQVPREEAEAYAKENGLLFFEASAKTGEGVVEVFTEIAKKIPLDHILASTRAPGGTARGTGRNAPGAAGRIDLNEAEAAKSDAYSSPFNDPPSEPRSRYLASSRSVSQSNISSSMREALKDVVTIRPVVNSPSRSTSGPVPIAKDDILTSTSPAKQRESNRDKSSPSKSRSKESSKEGEKERAKGGENKKEGTAGKGKKADVPFDVIDRLDISGLYGGGSFHRHDGPYAAATASRNKGPRAPMAAFDPSALAPPASGSRPPRNGSSALSARAQATLAAMDIEAAKAGESPYGAGALPRRALGRRASDSSITMGFPSTAANGKGQQLIEIYGVRDNEAWEDFGTSRFTAVGDGQSFSSSKESVGPVAGSGEDRDRLGRAQSIWDIEATLRAGKPVGQSLPPPPTPIILHELTSPPLPSVSGSTDNKPKRSKSLVQRFRAGRRNPNNPISDDYEEPDALAAPASSPMTIPSSSTPLNMVRDENGRFSSSEGAPPAPQGARSLPTTIRFKSAESPARTRQTPFTAPSTAPPVPTSRGFGGGVPLAGSRSLGQEGVVETPTREVPVRRPSVMQRLFSSKGK